MHRSMNRCIRAYRTCKTFSREMLVCNYCARYLNGLRIILVLLFFITAKNSVSQAPAIEWQKSFGGTLSEIAYSIQRTTDGGYIVAGCAVSNNGDVTGVHSYPDYADYWLVKINSAGNLQWQKCMGGSALDVARCVQQTSDGGFIVAGYSNSNDGNVSGNHSLPGREDYWIVKLDATGNMQWQKCLGGSLQDNARSIQQTSDGGYIVAGWSSSNDGDVSGNHGNNDYWVVKLDVSGNIQWQKSLGGSATDEAWAVRQTTDGGYVVAGASESNDGDVSGNHGGEDYWIVKLDAAGNIQWQHSLGGHRLDLPNAIRQTTDGGYIVAGQTYSSDGDVTGMHGPDASDYWIVKLDASGNSQWKKCLGGSDYDVAYDVQQTVDGGYIVTGLSGSTDGDVTGHHPMVNPTDLWTVKLDDSGTMQWQKCLGGSFDDEGFAIQQTPDQGYVIAGRSFSSDGDVTGHHGTNNESDFWIVKLSCVAGIMPGVISGNGSPCLSSTVTYTVGSLTGATGYTWSLPPGWTIISGQGTNSVTVAVGSNGGNIYVVANFACGDTPPQTLTVTPVSNSFPQVSISSNAGTTICEGATVTFSANAINAGTSPTYQWKINGVNVGTNAATFNSNALANGDVVTCVLTNNDGCANPASVVSPGITVTVIPGLLPSVNIASDATSICADRSISFTASALNAGTSPTYQWRLNGANIAMGPVFTFTYPPGNYQVDCIVTPGSNNCSTGNVNSNIIPVTVEAMPAIIVNPADTIVKPGTQLQLRAIVNGNIQSFNWLPASDLVNSSSLSPTTVSLVNTKDFWLNVVSTDGCTASAKATIRIYKKLYMPNAFTPNDDGLNDVFRIPPDVSLKLKNFSIYNRWGEKIFFTTDISKGWDGMIKGVKQPGGIYIYYLNGSDESGNVLLKGSFVLIR